ncbi:Rossmann-like and DUF2520 domain-containing protein [uncultured Deefgea sp.]|uniref:Rossmann-like and DUF2520 domain-containing protein n=1 Tax=uncultured Deefgea sp. TaxID=1304914 RepID=UPI00259369B6|nr:Rossmann-like and DUF2520 domain-containing protein [uncultured Deefgea sp.]
MLKLNLIGPGRLGQSMARLAQLSGQYQIAGVLARTPAAQGAMDFIGAGQAVTTLSALPAADLWLLAVPDSAIAAVASELAQAGVIAAGNVVFHASGALDAQQLASLRAQGAALASVHPAFSFADPARAVATFAGTLCAIEGDAVACARLQAWVSDLGGVPFALQAGGKTAYHAALTMAANYLVTLAEVSLQTANQAGIAPEMAQRLVLGLMQQTLNNIVAIGPAAALTGPIVRGDSATVAQHLAVLPRQYRSLYQVLGQHTLCLAGERLNPQQRQALAQYLHES